MEPSQNYGRHSLLPAKLIGAELTAWLQSSAVEKFTDEQKRIFSQDELKDFEHESSVNGREMNRLNDIVTVIKKHVIKGGKEPLELIVPATLGTKFLDTFRRQNDDLIECGYEMIETEIFGIPSAESESMEFFDASGNHIPERSRPLSPREKHKYLGMFQQEKSRIFMPNNLTGNDGQSEESKTGTDN